MSYDYLPHRVSVVCLDNIPRPRRPRKVDDLSDGGETLTHILRLDAASEFCSRFGRVMYGWTMTAGQTSW